MQQVDDFAITEAMIQTGGGFVSGLGKLWRQADPVNQERLKLAFTGYWTTYRDRCISDRSKALEAGDTRAGAVGKTDKTL